MTEGNEAFHLQSHCTPEVARAVRVLMVSAAALEEKDWIDPLPIFEGGPVERLKAAHAEGIDWPELYADDANVRKFVDALVDVITRG